MPIYDYKCSQCDTVKEVIKKISELDREELCATCSGHMDRLIVAPKLRLFRSGWYEHIAPDPIYIDNMKQLKKECADHGCTSQYAEDIC